MTFISENDLRNKIIGHWVYVNARRIFAWRLLKGLLFVRGDRNSVDITYAGKGG